MVMVMERSYNLINGGNLGFVNDLNQDINNKDNWEIVVNKKKQNRKIKGKEPAVSTPHSHSMHARKLAKGAKKTHFWVFQT